MLIPLRERTSAIRVVKLDVLTVIEKNLISPWRDHSPFVLIVVRPKLNKAWRL